MGYMRAQSPKGGVEVRAGICTTCQKDATSFKQYSSTYRIPDTTLGWLRRIQMKMEAHRKVEEGQKPPPQDFG